MAPGFDPASVPTDRRGIADSIRGRIERRGGTVEIDSEPGAGTEVAIALPRGRPDRDRHDRDLPDRADREDRHDRDRTDRLEASP